MTQVPPLRADSWREDFFQITAFVVVTLNVALSVAYLGVGVWANRNLLRRLDALLQQQRTGSLRRRSTFSNLREERLVTVGERVGVARSPDTPKRLNTPSALQPQRGDVSPPPSRSPVEVEIARPSPQPHAPLIMTIAFPSLPSFSESIGQATSSAPREPDDRCSQQTPLLAANRTPHRPGFSSAFDPSSTFPDPDTSARCVDFGLLSDRICVFYLFVIALCLSTSVLLLVTTLSMPTDERMAHRVHASQSCEADFMTLPVAAFEYSVLVALVFALWDSTPERDTRSAALRRWSGRAAIGVVALFVAASTAMLFAARDDPSWLEVVEWVDVGVALVMAGGCFAVSAKLPSALAALGLYGTASKTQTTLRVCAAALVLRAAVLFPPVQKALPGILPYSLPIVLAVNAVPVVLSIAILRS